MADPLLNNLIRDFLEHGKFIKASYAFDEETQTKASRTATTAEMRLQKTMLDLFGIYWLKTGMSLALLS